jgi:hypothetical protein
MLNKLLYSNAKQCILLHGVWYYFSNNSYFSICGKKLWSSFAWKHTPDALKLQHGNWRWKCSCSDSENAQRSSLHNTLHQACRHSHSSHVSLQGRMDQPAEPRSCSDHHLLLENAPGWEGTPSYLHVARQCLEGYLFDETKKCTVRCTAVTDVRRTHTNKQTNKQALRQGNRLGRGGTKFHIEAK